MTENARSDDDAPGSPARSSTRRAEGTSADAACRRVLVVRFGRIGDVLVLTPALRAIARAHPAAAVDVLTTAAGLHTLAGNPHIRDVHVLRARRLPRLLNPERASLVKTLRAYDYDTVFLLEGAERYHALVREIGARRVYGFARDDEPETDTRVRRAPDRHEGLRFLDVLGRARILATGVHYDFHVDDAARDRVRAMLAASDVPADATVAGIHAGHFQRRIRRGTPHAKAWPEERYAEVVRRLAQRGMRVVLTGGAGERALNRRISARVPEAGVVDMAGRTDLSTLAALIERCVVFLAPDTGPAHLAAAVGTPLVALFGPKAPHIMGPLGDDMRIARLYPEPSRDSDVVRGGHHPRMWAIAVEDVMDAIERVGGPSAADAGTASADATASEAKIAGGPPGSNLSSAPGHSHSPPRHPPEPGA